MVRMMGEVKTQHAKPTARREKAAATRRRIIDAATQLFSEKGYAGTTMQAIADQAGVAVQTVYFVFHTKGELLRQLLLAAGGRPDDPTETMQRGWVDEALTDPDGRRTLALMVEHGNDIYTRIAPVWAAISQGASVEPEVAAQWDGIVEQRRLGILRMVESIADRGHLRHGLTVDRAADIIFGLQRPETLTVFVVERNWSLVEYKAWSYDTLIQQLIDPAATRSIKPSPTRGLTFD